MRFSLSICLLLLRLATAFPTLQTPVLRHGGSNRTVSATLFRDLEELARIVDISYCVGMIKTGIAKPFRCRSRCADFPSFELVTTWHTGLLKSDSCGYIALDHSPSNPRILVAFRGTHSIANAVTDLTATPQAYEPFAGDTSSGNATRCDECRVHSGFRRSWEATSNIIVPHVQAALIVHPNYKLHLVGHSLGGAVATLSGLDFVNRGWEPTVTTFGAPRLGNIGLMKYIDKTFDLVLQQRDNAVDGLIQDLNNDLALRFRRVTHIDDPVPLLPSKGWDYRMHAGEIYITKAALSPDIQDLRHCFGDEDSECIAGQDKSLADAATEVVTRDIEGKLIEAVALVKHHMADGLSDELSRVIPARYKLWELFFAHRDYFWRLGLCFPAGDPSGGGAGYHDLDI